MMDLLSNATFWGWVYVGSEWAIRLAMLVVVPFRRNPEAAKGWLMLIFFLPWPGLVLYHLIGRPTLPKWRLALRDRMQGAFDAVRQRLAKSPNITHPQLSTELTSAVRLAQSLGQFRILGGNSAELLPEYDGAIGRLVADIDAAKKHVHLLYYIFADDAVGGRVVEALRRASRRGVKCRVLIDALGSRAWLGKLLPKIQETGAEAHAVLPVGLFRRKSARADLRNHRKIAVIDSHIGYVGSQNLVSATFKKGIDYEEMVVRVTGPIALELQGVFAQDWYLESEEALDTPEIFSDPAVTGTVAAQALPSGPGYATQNVQRLLVALIHGARERVVITTPYFIPDDSLLQALQTAVLRGVKVYLVLSAQRDQLLVCLAQRSYYTQLLEAGVHVHLYQPRFLHAKHASIDGEVALIGSSNMDIRSFVLNSEVTLLLYDRDVVNRLAAEQERYFANSVQLSLREWRTRSLLTKLLENMARMLSPLL